MKELKLIAFVSLLALPLSWGAALSAPKYETGLDQALASLLLGSLPLLGTLLFWQENFRPDAEMIRFGANRRKIALLSLSRAIAAMLLFALLGSAIALGLLSQISGREFLYDVLATAAVALAGALSLGSVLALSRFLFGKWGLSLMLLLSWLLGTSDLLGRTLLPSGHIRTLLGIGQELPFAPWVSFVILYAMAALSTLWIAARIPR